MPFEKLCIFKSSMAGKAYLEDLAQSEKKQSGTICTNNRFLHASYLLSPLKNFTFYVNFVQFPIYWVVKFSFM